MDDVSGRRHRSLPNAARRAVTLTMAACLLGSCSTSATVHRPAGSNLPGSTPATLPATRDPAALAHQIDRAAATLRDARARASDVQRAAEFQQLAVGSLATSSGAFRRSVTGRLRPDTAPMIRSDVRAARLLGAMTKPQHALPRWRIVSPPPATRLLGYYHEAQRRTGVPWTYLAAIHLVETRMGRIRGASTAGALGPMQFLPPTWKLYGAGGDINDPRDAILAAARLLRDNGAPDDMAEALRHFNPSDSYVRAVSEYSRTMQQSRSAYRTYWNWRVLYRKTDGTYVMPVGYPHVHATLLKGAG